MNEYMNTRVGVRLYKVAWFATADLLKEEVPEGQMDGVSKTARICKSPKIDVTSISPTYYLHHMKYVLQNTCMHS